MQKSDGVTQEVIVWTVYVCPHCQRVMQKVGTSVAEGEERIIKCNKCAGLVAMPTEA